MKIRYMVLLALLAVISWSNTAMYCGVPLILQFLVSCMIGGIGGCVIFDRIQKERKAKAGG